MAKKKSEEKSWKHVGGGCMISDAGKYPCDDTYVNVDTNETISVVSTMEAHFNMPARVGSKEELLKMKGVKLES